jgi:hypothetical protein
MINLELIVPDADCNQDFNRLKPVRVSDVTRNKSRSIFSKDRFKT